MAGAAAILVAELVLWTVARFIPITWAPVGGAVIPAIGVLGLRVAVVRARPDRRDRARGRRRGLSAIASPTLELATAFPASAGPADPDAPVYGPHG